MSADDIDAASETGPRHVRLAAQIRLYRLLVHLEGRLTPIRKSVYS
jgi:hypothetical protein